MQYCKLHRGRLEERHDENDQSNRRFPAHYLMYPRSNKPEPVTADKLITCNKHLQKCINSWNLNTNTPCYHCKNFVQNKSRYDADQSDSHGLYETASTSNSEHFINALYTTPKQSKKSSTCCPIHKAHRKDCPVSIAKMKCRPVSSGSMLDLLKLIKEECKCSNRMKSDKTTNEIAKRPSVSKNNNVMVTKDSFCKMIAPFIKNIDTEFATVIVGPKDQMNTIDLHIRKNKEVEPKLPKLNGADTKLLEIIKPDEIEPATVPLCTCKPEDDIKCFCSKEVLEMAQNQSNKDDPKASVKPQSKELKGGVASDCSCTLSVINNKKNVKANTDDKQNIFKNCHKYMQVRNNRNPENERPALTNTKVYAALEELNYTPWKRRVGKTTLSNISERTEKSKNRAPRNQLENRLEKLTIQNVLNCDNKILKEKAQDDKSDKSSILSGMTDNLRANICKMLEHAILKVSKNIEKKNAQNIKNNGKTADVEVIGDCNKHNDRDISKQNPKLNLPKNMLYTTKHSSRGDMQIYACPMNTKEENKLVPDIMLREHRNIIAQHVRNVEGYNDVLRNTNPKYYIENSKKRNYENERYNRHLPTNKKSPDFKKSPRSRVRSHSVGKAITCTRNDNLTGQNIPANHKPFGKNSDKQKQQTYS